MRTCLESLLNSSRAPRRRQASRFSKYKSDNGGEYSSRKFQDCFRRKDTVSVHCYILSYNERSIANRTIIKNARSMLHQLDLLHSLWHKADAPSVYLKYRMLRKQLEMTPFKIWNIPGLTFHICEYLSAERTCR